MNVKQIIVEAADGYITREFETMGFTAYPFETFFFRKDEACAWLSNEVELSV
jgi:hypothetical protein